MTETPSDVQYQTTPSTGLPVTVRTGVDIQSISQFRTIDPQVRDAIKCRSFTDREREYCEQTGDPPQHYAVRWAAKEAFQKVVTATVPFESVGVTRTERPQLELTATARTALTDTLGTDRWTVDLSLSHDRSADAAIAQLIVIGDD